MTFDKFDLLCPDLPKRVFFQSLRNIFPQEGGHKSHTPKVASLITTLVTTTTKKRKYICIDFWMLCWSTDVFLCIASFNFQHKNSMSLISFSFYLFLYLIQFLERKNWQLTLCSGGFRFIRSFESKIVLKPANLNLKIYILKNVCKFYKSKDIKGLVLRGINKRLGEPGYSRSLDELPVFVFSS